MKEVLKNKYVQIALFVIALFVAYKIYQWAKRSIFVGENILGQSATQTQLTQGGTALPAQNTITTTKAHEYASRIVNDVDNFDITEWLSLGFAGGDDKVYTEMMALTPSDLVLINNDFLKSYHYQYKTIAEFIRAKSSWLTENQKLFLAKFEASIK